MNQLFNKYPGSTIAIIGSGPTAMDFQGKEDVSIALNAAVVLEREFTYFQAFDLSLDSKGWFYNHTGPRIIGAGLAPVDKLVYPNLPDHLKSKIRGNELSYTKYMEKEIPPPTPPHQVFFYCRRCVPVFDKEPTELSSVGNIAIPGTETAILMGANEIHFYGIDLNTRYYFFDPNKKLGNYLKNSVQFLNQLLEKCKANNIKIKVKRGPNNNITVGDDLA